MCIGEKQMQKNCRHCTMSKANQKNKIIQSTIKSQLMQMKCSSNKNLGHQANKWWQKEFSSLCIFFSFFHLLFFNFICSDVFIQKWLNARLKFSIFQCSTWYFSGNNDNTLSIFVFHFCYCFLFLSLFFKQTWWNFSFHLHYLTQLFLYYYDLNVLCCFILYLNRYMKSDENDKMKFCRYVFIKFPHVFEII
jgi:hypothetical protein